MSNSVVATSAAAPAAVAVTPASGDGNVAAKAKSQYNAAVVQASLMVALRVALHTSNQLLALVLKTALTGMNEALQGQYGEHAIAAWRAGCR